MSKGKAKPKYERQNAVRLLTEALAELDAGLYWSVKADIAYALGYLQEEANRDG